MPDSLAAGASATAAVWLDAPAPTGGAVVSLVSSNALLAVPPSVTVPAGGYSAPFTMANSYAGKGKSVTLTATYNGAVSTGSFFIPVQPTIGGGGGGGGGGSCGPKGQLCQ